MADVGVVDNAAVADHGMIDLRAVDLAAGQEARARKNRRDHVVKIKTRQLAGGIDVSFKKAADGADVLPVALEDVSKDAMFFDEARDDVLAEIRKFILEETGQHVAVEDVNAYGRQKELV